jgi:glyoxylase-like metal-dependent hydrolase (beta-lactamase superfamily II)
MVAGSGIYRAESRNEVVYALECDGAYAMIDVGSEAGLASKLDQLQAQGIAHARIAALLLTHCHEDHAGAVSCLRSGEWPRVVAHRLAVEHLRQCPAYSPLDQALVDYTVDDGDTVEIGELVFRVHHLPGHTPDSIAWQVGDSLFLGDLLRCDGTLGWMDVHWGSCLSDYRSSLHRLLSLNVSRIYPGHGECGPFTREAVEEGLRRLEVLAEADGRLLQDLGRPAPRRPTEVPSKIIRLSTARPAM